MSSTNTQTIEIQPEYIDQNGDVVAPQEYIMPVPNPMANDWDLRQDHAEISHQHDPAQEDLNPGPSIRLADHDKYLLETLDAVSLAKKAQGRANNRYNRVAIGQNIGREAYEVNEDGAAMLPEHLGHASRVFNKLMGYSALRAAGFDTTGLPTLSVFMGTYFGSKQASRENHTLRLRSQIKKRGR